MNYEIHKSDVSEGHICLNIKHNIPVICHYEPLIRMNFDDYNYFYHGI